MDLSNVRAQQEGWITEWDPLLVLFLFSLYLSLALKREEGGNKWKVGRRGLQRPGRNFHNMALSKLPGDMERVYHIPTDSFLPTGVWSIETWGKGPGDKGKGLRVS